MDITPKTLFIQLTNFCNNHCTICIYRNNTRGLTDTKHMSSNIIEKILENITKTKSIDNILFGPLYGEAQLHPYFYTLVERIKMIRSNIKITLLTNGKLITEDNLEKYKGDHVQISVLGNKTRPNTYNAQTGLNWNDLKIKAKLLFAADISYGFSLNMTTLDDIEEAILDLHELPGFSAIYRYKIDIIKNQDTKDFLIRCKYLNLKYNVRLNDDEHHFDDAILESGLTNITFNNIYEYCHQLYDVMTITVDGDILVCPCEMSCSYKSGNIMLNTLLEIFNTTHMNNVRNLVAQRQFALINPCATLCGYKHENSSSSKI